MAEPVVECIDLSTLTVIMSDGMVLPITDLFDKYGDDCEPDDAVAIVAGSEAYGWLDIEIVEKRTLH